MFIKAKQKIIRKFDCDFWNFIYTRRRKNKFFTYFKLSLLNNIQKYYKNQFFSTKRNLIEYKKNTLINLELSKRFKKIKFLKLFKKPKYFVKKIFYKLIMQKKSKLDILIGANSAFKRYVVKTKSRFTRYKNFLKNFCLFYNDITLNFLKRLSTLCYKSKKSGLNFFYKLLESRLDSIILRLNIGNKFVVRNYIKGKKILVDNKYITFTNFIINSKNLITFEFQLKQKLYKILLLNIKFKRFFTQPPYYFEINYKTLTLLLLPKLINIKYIAYPFQHKNTKLLMGIHTILWGW